MKIYKYKLAIQDLQDLVLPVESTILSVGVQNEALCLWALVDEKETKTVTQQIAIIGTGNSIELPYLNEFLGTCQIYHGQLVFHVFKY